MVDGKEFALVRERQKLEEIWSHEHLPEWLQRNGA
jgi:hypothetical protein